MVVSFTERKNFGIDWSMVESLPNFKFRVLRGQKEGLNCAVCLNKFKVAKVLRLLSKCKHAFHVECVDSWLDVHSMCPLCCYCMDPEDIFLVEEAKPFHQSHQQQNNDQGRVCLNLDLEKQGIVKSRQRHLFVRGGGRRNNRGVATESEVDDVI
ncbi:RING-H2 finger protein ATL43-like [Glycine soja]|nr:RING-H2 finger protein ATL43-like [Glycine soja]